MLLNIKSIISYYFVLVTATSNGIQTSVRHKYPTIDTTKQFAHLDFTVPNDSTWWVWDDYMETAYWKRLTKWKQMPLTVYLIPFSHADAFWTYTFEEYYHTQVRFILNNIVSVLPQLESMKFVWSDIAFLHYWWERASPKSQEIVKELVNSGRLEIVTGGWIMPDEATTTVYGLIEQLIEGTPLPNHVDGMCWIMPDEATTTVYGLIEPLIEGHEWVHEYLNVLPETSWAIDPFGLSSTMPYLLEKAGITGGLLIQRIHYAWQRLLGRMGHSELMWRQEWDVTEKSELKLRIQHSCTYVITDTCGPASPLCNLYDFAHHQEIHFKDIRRKAEMLLGQYGRLGSLSRKNFVVVPLGGDFRFSNVTEWTRQYDNYKAIMDYINNNYDLYHTRIQFATLKDFFRTVGYPVIKLQGDFFPHSDFSREVFFNNRLREVYWTGYYSTRPRLKLLSRTVGARLRAVDILFSLGTVGLCTRNTFYLGDAQKKLQWSRRTWSMFQHHDGITGTSTERVMKHEEKLLKRAQRYLKETFEDLIPQILALTIMPSGSPCNRCKTSISTVENPGKLATIAIFNPAEVPWNDLLAVWFSKNVESINIFDNGERVPHQIVYKGNKTMCYFRTNVSPLSLKVLQMIEFEKKSEVDEPFAKPHQNHTTFSNNMLNLTFEEGNLKSVISEQFRTDILVRLGTYHLYDGFNGAYLFKPCPRIRYCERVQNAIFQNGPIFQEVINIFDCGNLTIRLLNYDDRPAIHLSVEYNILLDDYQLFVEISSEIVSKKWFTDVNDFQFRERVVVNCLGLEGNVYPMTSATYIEDDLHRIVVISDHSHGVAHPRLDTIQVMLGRKTSSDDGKGMGEPLRDNGPTVSKFLVLLYKLINLKIDVWEISRQINNPVLAMTIRKSDRMLTSLQHKKLHHCKTLRLPTWPKDYVGSINQECHLLNKKGQYNDNFLSEFESHSSPCDNKMHFISEFPLIMGTIKPGVRVVSMRSQLLRKTNQGRWVLLILHNTNNYTVHPFSVGTHFSLLQIHNVVETTLTGILEIEQYAILSDIIIIPLALKTLKLYFKSES